MKKPSRTGGKPAKARRRPALKVRRQKFFRALELAEDNELVGTKLTASSISRSCALMMGKTTG
jgi:hypothetical protein